MLENEFLSESSIIRVNCHLVSTSVTSLTSLFVRLRLILLVDIAKQ